MPGGEEAEAGRLIAAIGLQASKHFLTFYHLLSPPANPFLTKFVHHQFFHIAVAMIGHPMKL